MFIIAIPLSQLNLWDLTHASQYLIPDRTELRAAQVLVWWDNIQ